jgi:hypothetical protein
VTESDGNTETAFELVSISTSTQRGELHFLADSLSSSATTTFYLYYGNSGASPYAATATYGRNNVWNQYTSVWHMQEGSGTRNDSDVDTNDLTAIATPASTTGKIGVAQNIQSPDLDGLSITDGSQVGLDFTGNHSWSFLVSPDTTNLGAAVGLFNSKFAGGGQLSYLYRYNGDFIINLSSNGSANTQRSFTYSMTGGEWYWVTFSYTASAGSVDIYVNDTLVSTQTGFPTSVFNGSATTYISGTDNGQWDGLFDETRASASTTDLARVVTKYNNAFSTSTFMYISAAEINGTNLPATVLRSGMISGSTIIK